MRTIGLVDEAEHVIIELEWDDLSSLPDVDSLTSSKYTTRRASIADEAISFLDELRRLNRRPVLA